MALFLVALSVFATCNFVLNGAVNDVPVGHMKPLGAHMPPEQVDEITAETVLSPEKFWKDYVSKRKPVVFRGAAKNSPSMTKWTDDYLKEKYGDLEVRIEAKKEKQGYIPVGDLGVGRDTIRNFINTYHEKNKYIVSELPRQMQEEIMVIPSMACGGMSKRIVEVDWWMNGGNASSIIHKDAFNQINCLMNGTKEWKLIEYQYEKSIYKAWEDEREIGGYSRINPNKVDMLKYPKIASVPWKFTVLNGGDCMYLPGSMYHQVTSYGSNNFAVSLLFSRFDYEKKLDFTDCQSSLNYTKLSNLDVDWQYPGTGIMTMGAPDLEHVRGRLLSETDKKGRFFSRGLQEIIQSSFPNKDRMLIKREAQDALKRVTEITGQKLNRKIIKNMSKEALRILALTFQPVDASNTYDHEYTYVSPHGIQYIVKELLKKGEQLERKSFVTRYTKDLFGSEKFGNRIFDIIAGESANTATKSQVKSKLQEALQKYFEMQREEQTPPDGETTEGDAYDRTNADTEMFETGMPDMTDDEDDTDENESSPKNSAEDPAREESLKNPELNEASSESKDEL